MIRFGEYTSFGRQLLCMAKTARRRHTAEQDESALIYPGACYVDIVITAADVIKGVTPTTSRGTAGATITAGQPVYIDATDSNKIKPTDANLSDAAAACVGIALHASLAGQPIEYQTGGNITLSPVLTLGKAYVCSANAGGIAPIADLATGWRTTYLGVAQSTTSLLIGIQISGVTNA